MSAKIKNVTLELSGKAFTDDSQYTMYNVCRKMFTQWKLLTDRADIVSVLLFIADGSEILEYAGDLSQDFEWSYWFGCANHCPQAHGNTERVRRDTHAYPIKYREDAKPRPYAWLKRLIEVIKETGSEITGKPIRVGAMYDNGPECHFRFQVQPSQRDCRSAYSLSQQFRNLHLKTSRRFQTVCRISGRYSGRYEYRYLSGAAVQGVLKRYGV